MASMAVEAFRAMIRHLTPGLKAEGFAKHGAKFSRLVSDNVAIIEFQRSPDSTPVEYVFFVNLGVVSRKVAWFETGRSKPDLTPGEDHWWTRLGELLPDQAQWGWRIETEDDAPLMAEGILKLIRRHGLPALEAHVSDAALLDHWTRILQGYEGGDIRPLIRLSILAAAYGDLQLSSARYRNCVRRVRAKRGWKPTSRNFPGGGGRDAHRGNSCSGRPCPSAVR